MARQNIWVHPNHLTGEYKIEPTISAPLDAKGGERIFLPHERVEAREYRDRMNSRNKKAGWF